MCKPNRKEFGIKIIVYQSVLVVCSCCCILVTISVALLCVAQKSNLSMEQWPCSNSHSTTCMYPPEVVVWQTLNSSQGQWFSLAHWRMCKWPWNAATEHTLSDHGQPCKRSHCRTKRWPFSAAEVQVYSSHGQPSARNHCSSSTFPAPAAAEQTIHT